MKCPIMSAYTKEKRKETEIQKNILLVSKCLTIPIHPKK